MNRFWACLGLAAAATLWINPAAAGHARSAFPGPGATPGVDVYIPNPDPQPPVYWSQGTEPPPAQQGVDYGGGFLQYLLTGTERRPLRPRLPRALPSRGAAYGALAGEAVQAAVDPIYQRQIVAYDGPASPGTIVVDTTSKFLYLVEGNRRAMRYGIGVGRPGFLWHGTKTITRKAEWPDWTPPSEMIGRRPDLPRHMEGGIANPLGARAMYLGSSLYRIHGTNEPNTIGTNVSSGCIRLLNEDVADLYARVRVGTRVVVL